MRIILVGFGVVGRSIAEVILEKTNLLVKNYGISPKVVAIVDSQGCALDPRGLDLTSFNRQERLRLHFTHA